MGSTQHNAIVNLYVERAGDITGPKQRLLRPEPKSREADLAEEIYAV